MTDSLKKWYHNLTDSEQRLLTGGGILIVVVLCWVMLYKPVTERINAQVAVKATLQQQLEQMQTISGSMVTISIQEKQGIPTGITFSSWVDQQLRLVKLQDYVNRTEPIDQDSLSVWLQGVAFDQVIDWLQVMAAQYGVQVDQIDINVVDSALGLTNIRMRLVK